MLLRWLCSAAFLCQPEPERSMQMSLAALGHERLAGHQRQSR